MIFLIDEKTERQEIDYAWTQERFNDFLGIIRSISSYEDLENGNLREEIFADDSIVLFHESFFDNVLNNHPKDSRLIREKLTAFTEKNGNSLVYFSGSKVDRHINGNIAHLPVSVLYQNLEVFLSEVKSGNIDLRNLLFGRDFFREEKLLQKIQDSNSAFDSTPLHTAEVTFLALSLEDEIPVSIQESTDETFFTDDKFNHLISDEYLDQRVKEWFYDVTFDKIFIPLCFGNVLSDFNGLRLALHIRTTDTKNKLTPLFIYSPVEHRDFLNNDFYDVLKTKNIFLISYSREGFLRSLAYRPQKLEDYQLPAELAKINLKVPSNYEDSHSVTNEWAIYRWARTLDASDEAIEKISRRVEGDSYFKYLNTRFPVSSAEIILENKLKIKVNNKPRILLIDDEANKGWYENLCKIFYDINGFEFIYLEEDYKTLSQDLIIEKGIKKVIEVDADIVILDFRLHASDFQQNDISSVTGLKMLEEIKQVNPGIQVIIFSATNKVWNMLELQKKGADSFLLKESPQNSEVINHTRENIMNFLREMERLAKRKFLKELHNKIHSIQRNLSAVDFEDETLFAEFISSLKTQLKIIKVAAGRISLEQKSSLDLVFMNCYNFLENFKSHYIVENKGEFLIGIEEHNLNRYTPDNRTHEIFNSGEFIRANSNDYPSWLNAIVGVFVDYFHIDVLNSQWTKNINRIKEKRNSYVHGNKLNFDQNEVLMIIELMVLMSERIKE